MAQVLVRNIDGSAMQRIKSRAKANGRSTEAEVRAIIESAAATSANEPRVPLTSLIGRAPSGRSMTEIVEYVRKLRDEWER